MALSTRHIYASDCPLLNVTCSKEGLRPLMFGTAPPIVSTVSCFLSMFGAILTILPYILWKDIRTGIRRIITFLAIADLFTAGGYVMGNVNFYFYIRNHGNDGTQTNAQRCVRFDEFCQIQSYISSWSSYSSFWWTSILALFLYWTIVKGEMKKGDRYFPLYHVLSWGSPILVMFPLLVTGSLGYSYVASGGWCFIRDEPDDSSLNYSVILKILVGGKAFEIGTYIWVLVVYGGIHWSIRQKKKEQSSLSINGGIIALLKQVQTKLYLIPAAFIFVRMWGTVQFVVSVFVFSFKQVDNQGCVPHGIYYLYYVLAILQCIGDGAQGWVNAILYILWSPKIRQRLITDPLGNCCYNVATHLIPSSQVPHTLSPVRSSTSSRSNFRSLGAIQQPDVIIDYEETAVSKPSSSHASTMLETLSRNGDSDTERTPLVHSEMT